MFGSKSTALSVVDGDFSEEGESRISGGELVLHQREPDGLYEIRYTAHDLASFEVVDGTWGDYFEKFADWASVIAAGAAAGLPGATANRMLPDLFPGQRFLFPWANAILGAAAAKKALDSNRNVTIRATFKDGAVLQAKVSERELSRLTAELDQRFD